MTWRTKVLHSVVKAIGLVDFELIEFMAKNECPPFLLTGFVLELKFWLISIPID